MKGIIAYAQIGGPACETLLFGKADAPSNPQASLDAYEYFGYRLEHWRNRLERDFTYPVDYSGHLKANWLLTTVFRIRANHLQTVVSRAFSCTEQHASQPPGIWQESVNNATNTIKLLGELNDNGTYRPLQAQCNVFLISALGILFLALGHNPMNGSSNLKQGHEVFRCPEIVLQSRDSANRGLSLLYKQTERSHHARYLWSCLKNLAARFSLDGYNQDPRQAQNASVVQPAPPCPDVLGVAAFQLGQAVTGWDDIQELFDIDALVPPLMDTSQDLSSFWDETSLSSYRSDLYSAT